MDGTWAVAAPLCQLHPEASVDKQRTVHMAVGLWSQHIQNAAPQSTVTVNPAATIQAEHTPNTKYL